MTSKTNDDTDGGPIEAASASRRELLARCKRASLRSQAQRAAWQLGALLRRVEREAPEVHRRLRSAVEALQVLGARLSLELEVTRPVGSELARGEAAVRVDGSERTSEAELF